jgi:hypothetical protein
VCGIVLVLSEAVLHDNQAVLLPEKDDEASAVTGAHKTERETNSNAKE